MNYKLEDCTVYSTDKSEQQNYINNAQQSNVFLYLLLPKCGTYAFLGFALL